MNEKLLNQNSSKAKYYTLVCLKFIIRLLIFLIIDIAFWYMIINGATILAGSVILDAIDHTSSSFASEVLRVYSIPILIYFLVYLSAWKIQSRIYQRVFRNYRTASSIRMEENINEFFDKLKESYPELKSMRINAGNNFQLAYLYDTLSIRIFQMPFKIIRYHITDNGEIVEVDVNYSILESADDELDEDIEEDKISI